MNKRNYIRKHNVVTFYLSGISHLAFMAIVTTLTEMGYTVSITDLHIYDDDDELYSVTFELDLTARYHVYGISKDWNRMHKAAALIYSTLRHDLMERRYTCGSISMSFFRDSDAELIYHYTVFTTDYSNGNNDGSIRYERLR